MEKLGTNKIIELNGQNVEVSDTPHTTGNMIYAIQDEKGNVYYTNRSGYDTFNNYYNSLRNQPVSTSKIKLGGNKTVNASSAYDKTGTNVYAVIGEDGNTYYTDYEGYKIAHNIPTTTVAKPRTTTITLENGEQIVANTTYNQDGSGKSVYAVKGTDGKTYYTDYNGYKANNNITRTQEEIETQNKNVDYYKRTIRDNGSYHPDDEMPDNSYEVAPGSRADREKQEASEQAARRERLEDSKERANKATEENELRREKEAEYAREQAREKQEASEQAAREERLDEAKERANKATEENELRREKEAEYAREQAREKQEASEQATREERLDEAKERANKATEENELRREKEAEYAREQAREKQEASEQAAREERLDEAKERANKATEENELRREKEAEYAREQAKQEKLNESLLEESLLELPPSTYNVEEMPESIFGDFVVDKDLLASAYESVLDMRSGIVSCISSLEYTTPSFPGESLSGKECSSAHISKPQYSSIISSAFASLKSTATAIEEKINILADTVNNQIESFNSLSNELESELSDLLSKIWRDKITGLDDEAAKKFFVNNFDLSPSEEKAKFIGSLSESDMALLEEKVGRYYKNSLEHIELGINKNQEKLDTVEDLLNMIPDFEFILNENQKMLNDYKLQIQNDISEAKMTGNAINLEKYGITAADLDKDINDLYRTAIESSHYRNVLADFNYSIQKELDQITYSNDKFSEYQGMTITDILTRQRTIENSIAILNAYKMSDNEKLGLVPYDVCMYSEEYGKYLNREKVTANDITVPEGRILEVGYGFQNVEVEFSYDEYLKTHPGVSPIDFYMACQEKISTLPLNAQDEYGTTMYLYKISGVNEEEITKLLEINEYQRLVAEGKDTSAIKLIDSERDYLDIYEYLSTMDPAKVEDYLKKTAVINKYDGAKEALKEIEQLSLTDEGKIKETLMAYLNVASDGVGDGIYDFFEGFGKIFLKGELTAQDYKVMNYISYLEQNSNYLDNVYQSSMSVGTMLPTVTMSTLFSIACPGLAASGTIQALSRLAMATSTFGTTQNQLRYQGYADWQALLYAGLSAGSEFFLEKVGGVIGLADNPSADFFMNLLKEGKEEVIEQVLEYVVGDTLLLGKEFDITDMSEEAFQAFLGGVIVSGALNTWTKGLTIAYGGTNYILTGDDLGIITPYLAKINNIKDISGKALTSSLLEISNLSKKINFEEIDFHKIFNFDIKKLTDQQINEIKSIILSLSNKSNDTKAINILDNFFKTLDEYGVDQGYLYDLYYYRYNGKTYNEAQWTRYKKDHYIDISKLEKKATKEYFEIKDILIKKGFTKSAASALISGLDSKGACTYAGMANAIISTFAGKEKEFKKVFGFDMYIVDQSTGKIRINSGELLVDMYSSINSVENGGNLFKKEGDKYTLSPKGLRREADSFGRRQIDASKQIYLTHYDEVDSKFSNYLNNKGLKISTESYNSSTLKSMEQQQLLFNRVKNDLNNNSIKNVKTTYSMAIWSTDNPIRMISINKDRPDVSTASWVDERGRPSGAHEIFITGTTDTGFIVSSWGSSYLIPFSDLEKGTFRISKINISN